MIPNEKEIREYAKYAERVREVVREELSNLMGKAVSQAVLRELVRSATMPIGIWINNRPSVNSSERYLSVTIDESEKQRRLIDLISTYNLVGSNGYLWPSKILSRQVFQSLRSEMWKIGYIYEIGEGFIEELTH